MITIVVLLILAGVAMIRGQNGILSEAESAKEATENKGAEEKVGLAISAARAKGLGYYYMWAVQSRRCIKL